MQYKHSNQCRAWSNAVKRRVIAQKPIIAKWKVDCVKYHQIPSNAGHWHIDPPYNNEAGKKYPHHHIDYANLAEWCRSREGAVDVCENVGADWLPFKPLYEVAGVKSSVHRKGKSQEAVWRK